MKPQDSLTRLANGFVYSRKYFINLLRTVTIIK